MDTEERTTTLHEQPGGAIGEFGELQLTGGAHLMHDASELVSDTVYQAWAAYRACFDGWFEATIPQIESTTLWIGETAENVADDMTAIVTTACGYHKAAIDALFDCLTDAE